MFRTQVRTTEQALDYLIECNLATVEDMAMKKSRSKSEYERQKEIAQVGINWLLLFKIEPKSGRVKKVCQHFERNVSKYADTYDVLLKDKK